MKISLIVLVLLAVVGTNCSFFEYSDPTYDHQNTTYTSHVNPVTVKDQTFTITPFFSPDHSGGVQTNVVLNANDYVNIVCPSWDSWNNACNDGCTPEEQRNETFPVWQALLNAVHKGIKVRILTNDYNTTYPNPGTIDPLTFLFLNGAEIRYFTTLTFAHSKYIATDIETSVSSVNFDYTSYMQNREAGVVLSGSGSGPLQELYNSTFWEDWNQAFDFVPNQEYTSEQMQIITNPESVPVVVPPRLNLDTYDTPLDNISESMTATAFVSPDFAYSFVSEPISAATNSIYLYMYDTSGQMCDLLQTLDKDTIVKNSKILVSPTIDGSGAYDAAFDCYKDLYDYGYSIQLAPSTFSYAHQKFWIIDYGLADASVFVTTGNWVSEDLPDGPSVFPPYSESGWQDTNRDFNFMTTDTNVINVFYNTLIADYKDGKAWYPSDDSVSKRN